MTPERLAEIRALVKEGMAAYGDTARERRKAAPLLRLACQDIPDLLTALDEAREQVRKLGAEPATGQFTNSELLAALEMTRQALETATKSFNAEFDLRQSLLGRLVAVRADRDEAVALLRELEWAGEMFGYKHCPRCGAYGPPHAPDCHLAAVLKGGK